jgi:two-component system cell cycle sensor histidine kinase/response regulator CckA
VPARSDLAAIWPEDLERLVGSVARTLADSMEFRTVAISLYRPAWDDFIVAAVHGSTAARSALLGTTADREALETLLEERFRERDAYFVPYDAAEWERLDGGVARYLPDTNAAPADAGVWQPGDTLLVPFTRRDGGPFGIIAVADPVSGRRPGERELDRLASRSSLTARVVESRLTEEHDERHRRALEHLIRVSSELVRGHSTDAVLQLVCDGIAEALGFGHVVIELADDEADRYRPVAGAGIDLTSTNVQLSATIEALDRFFDPECELEGCYLATREEALARVGEEPGAFRSSTNGRGPYAWDRHWLLVPLQNRDDERIGFIWADNPHDHLLPSRERLQALRLFADQVATALEVAAANESARQELEERRQAEAALRKSQELYRRVVETSTDTIALFDLNGRVLFASPSCTTILGYEPSELVGRRFVDLIHPDDVAGASDVVRAALAGEGSRPHTARVCHRAGHWVSLEGIPAGIYDEDGTPEMVLGVARDVTERLRAEEERRSLEAQLRHSQKMEAVGRLAGGIAHDFNNLLTAIGGYGQLALASLSGDEPRVRRQLEELLRAADRAAALTRQLLAFSRRQVLQPRVLDLNTVVREVESMLARLIGADVELVTSLDSDLGPTHADPSQIEQVVVNLAVNARDAMRQGGRLLIETANAELDDDFASRHVGSRPGSYVSLTVADTGEGMDAEASARLFEPFFTTKGPGSGTGLGLSTVYGIVKQSHGYVAVDSEPGRGTVVTVYLPRVKAVAELESGASARAPEAVARGGSETVLVVEDEEIVRSLIREMLEGLGYTVVDARDGEEALSILSEGPPGIDLVITDLVMPRMSGRELARRVGELQPETAVLLVSGYAGDTATVHGPLETGTAFLEKPFNGAELAEKVRELLDSPTTTRARPAA